MTRWPVCNFPFFSYVYVVCLFLVDSVAMDWDERSSIATAMSGFSIDWKDLPEGDFAFDAPPHQSSSDHFSFRP